MYHIEDRALVESFSWKERVAFIIKVLPVLIIIGIMGSLYIVKNIAPDVPMSHVLLGVIPFVIIEILVIASVCIWPQLALWLPNKMIG